MQIHLLGGNAYKNGLVAQLNSASDYGSEGSRFESRRGHISNPQVTDIKVLVDFFMLMYRLLCGRIASEFQIYFLPLLVVSTTKFVFIQEERSISI